ncbi:MAG: polyphosphate polymerase domain-containing protein [Ancrocorticia sp.]
MTPALTMADTSTIPTHLLNKPLDNSLNNSLNRAVQLMPAISLEELNTLAALQTRSDRKYVLPLAMASELVAWLASADSFEEARVLDINGNRSSLYDSVYLDTPDLTCYRMAVQKNRRRFKVRRRTYMDSGQSFLEVKTKSASTQTVKNRIEWDALLVGEEACASTRDTPDSTWDTLGIGLLAGSLSASEFIAECLAPRVDARSLHLEPVLCTRYRRTTIHLAASNMRLTIDQDLTWIAADSPGTGHNTTGNPATGGIATGPATAHSDAVIVETKSPGHASNADRYLWAAGYRPLPSSKYAAGIALFHPELPRERWTRTIDRYLKAVVD